MAWIILATLACGSDEPGIVEYRELGDDGSNHELAHIHGLGLNPADGILYIATHDGLYRLQDGEVEPVGDRRWDVMGFTVRGPNDFIGGGHPTPKEIQEGDYPPLLGFIQSGDAAETWQILAMRGETDLHALAVGNGVIYAVDATSGRFLASTDGREWETRSLLVAWSIAVENDGNLLAAAPEGPHRSTDQGRTWTRLAGAPPLVLVAAQPGNVAWGIDAEGTIYRMGEDDAWASAGSVSGRPEAFSATQDRLFAATTAGVFTSSDGQTWTQLYSSIGD
jgi:hypothetical protein